MDTETPIHESAGTSLSARASLTRRRTSRRWVRDLIAARRGNPMKRLTALLVALMVSAGCATPPAPTASPLPVVRCVGIPETEPDVCGRMVALVEETHPDEVRDASRILVADTCPPQVLCDRQFLYDAVVLVVPADGDTAKALALRVFGHQGQPLGIEVWSGRLPEHVASLLAQG
jgi:hypothetical protein